MTYSDNYNIRTKNVKFNDVADAIDGVLTRTFGGTTSGTSSAYIATPSPTWTAYAAGELVTIIPHVANATSATLNVSGLGPIAIRRNGTGITANVFTANSPVLLLYNGVQFDVIAVDSSGSTGAPTGQITSFGGASAPSGWLVCDGTDYNTYTYRVLHAVVSNIYGGTAYLLGTTDQPAAITTFKVPDLRRRVPVGTGASDTLGFTEGGNNTGTAYASRSVSHTHTLPAHYHGMGTGADLNITSSGTHDTSIAHDHSAFTSGAGSAHSHTATDLGHTHGVSLSARSGAGNTASTTILSSYVSAGSTTYSFTNGSATTGYANISLASESAHTHSIDVPATGALNSSSTGAHIHAAGNISGSIGLVTGGVSGNAEMTSGATSPPLLFLNYIIKA